MRYRGWVLAILLISLGVLAFGEGEKSAIVSPTLVLGFMLLTAYCAAFFLEKLHLPRITGYILGGLLFGPYLLDFCPREAIADLQFINSLALAFIAFCAGGELKLDIFRHRLKSILFLLTGVTSVVFFGITLLVFGLSSFIPFMAGYPSAFRLAVSAIFGIIAVARSPSSTIAVISESRAKGPYTDTVLSVTIITDVLIIMLFGIIISFSQMLRTKSGGAVDPAFIIGMLLEIGVAMVAGFLLGKATVFLIDNVHLEFPIILTVVGFMVIKFSHWLGAFLLETYHVHVNLEPMLICMAAGFTVQNFSNHGRLFLARMDRVSLPIYIAFFAITGASIQLHLLKTGWLLGLVIVLSRTLMLFIGGYLSGRLSGDRPVIYRYTWLGFITQAGVSIGLLSEVVRRFPEIGVPIQTILIASITVNQLIGPIALKYALIKTGEAEKKD